MRDAKGDACVRPLPRGDERCLTGSESADLEVVWLDEDTLGVLSRRDLHGDFELRAHGLGGGSRTVVARNMIGVSRGPEGRLAYVDLERPEGAAEDAIGISFASRVGEGLRVVTLSSDGVANEHRFAPDLPGVSGFPAWDDAGRHLYFAQYLNDTNRDGRIDGNDHSVIFRVGFVATQSDPFAGQRLEQLTSPAGAATTRRLEASTSS